VTFGTYLAAASAVVRDTFKESVPVAYTREVGGTSNVDGIWDEAHETVELDPDSGAQVTTTGIAFDVRLADLAFTPHVRDTLVRGGVTYQVMDVQPDGSGFATLPLRRV
jgi:hypothetical protein